MSGTEGLGALRRLASAWRTIALVAVALLGAAVLAALIATQGEANRQRDRALAAQRHSFEVMILSRTLSGTIARAEASLGRYVISGDVRLGRLYGDEWDAAGQELDRLDQITDDRQQPQIDLLRAAYQERGRELDGIALSTAYKKNNQALALYYRASRATSLADINRLLNAIIAGEQSRLSDRTAAAMGSVAQAGATARLFIAFGVLIAIGAVALGWLTIQAMTERAVAQAEADELAAAVAQATAELREHEAKLRQAQKMDAVGQLTGGIAHDFNNMLAVVLGGLELARRHLPAEGLPARRHLDSAAEGAQRAAALTRQLLAFSREEALKPEPLRASALVAGMTDLLDRTLGDAITLEVSGADRGWTVFADKVALENAILNLAVNARDAMDGRGRLRLTLGAATLTERQVGACGAGDHVTLAVSDTGCGMTPEVLERAFEPFFTTKPAGRGTGLGLSQIFGLVRQLGGDIAIASAPRQGTTVTLYVPRHAAPATPLALAATCEPDESSVSSLDVLVVEDDPRVLAATMGALDELGHRPIACDDPLSAPALLARHAEVDLIVSDVLMPGWTGPEMADRLALDRPDLPVLFVTGYAGEGMDAASFGDRPVLRKPFTLAGLERAVAEAMAGRLSAAHQIAAE